MKKETNEFISSELQKSVRELISNECQLSLAFMLMVMACDKTERAVLREIFASISSDCVSNRLPALIGWCEFNDYDMPCTESEFRKCGTPKLLKLIDKVKKGEHAKYYMQLATAVMTELAGAYEKAVTKNDTCMYTDLQGLLWQSFYSIQDTLRKLNTAEIACDANVEMLI